MTASTPKPAPINPVLFGAASHGSKRPPGRRGCKPGRRRATPPTPWWGALPVFVLVYIPFFLAAFYCHDGRPANRPGSSARASGLMRHAGAVCRRSGVDMTPGSVYSYRSASAGVIWEACTAGSQVVSSVMA